MPLASIVWSELPGAGLAYVIPSAPASHPQTIGNPTQKIWMTSIERPIPPGQHGGDALQHRHTGGRPAYVQAWMKAAVMSRTPQSSQAVTIA
jgi:hypothetical protein